jgi:hypothetical protein
MQARKCTPQRKNFNAKKGWVGEENGIITTIRPFMLNRARKENPQAQDST